jgi:nitrite reductase/ring-hydroxylating ferredoxin subunit
LSEPSEIYRPGTFAVVIGDQHFEVPHMCPHRAGWLEHGVINERRKSITCPLHFSVFSLETGEQLSGPPCGRLEIK